MNALENTTPAAATPAHPGKSPLYAIVDVATWLWPRRRLLVAEMRAAKTRGRAKRTPSRKLRFAA